MLSRIAESVFWVGRYVERADSTARILDAHVHQLVGSLADEESACEMLADVMGLSPPAGSVDVPRLVHLLALDDDNASSIVSCLRLARENARGARELLSAEMWECLNATWYALPGQLAAVAYAGSHAFFRFVSERSALFAGLTDATMSRDDAWRFLVLGRSVERVDMMARLLGSGAGRSDSPTDWAMLLGSCSAQEAFLRTDGREARAEHVLDFLLFDRLFPRSVFHALSTAETCLTELDPGSRDGRLGEAGRVLGHARATLEYQRHADLLANLAGLLEFLQQVCADAGEELALRFFRHAAALEWTPEGAGV